MSEKPKSMLDMAALAVGIVWTAILSGYTVWGIDNEKVQTYSLSMFQARAFFQEIVTTRSWNAQHGGVYVPVTSKTQPNPYLDDPDRDVVTSKGLQLTKINPAYMTRQIAEIAEQNNLVRFHITSAEPIRPANAPDPWERQALASFLTGPDEQSGFIEDSEGNTNFRYMAPLWVENACLKCHASQGYQKGDLRGGISVTLSADSILAIQQGAIRKFTTASIGIWLIGFLGILLGHRLLKREELQRIGVIARLQETLAEVKMLSGLLPICSICKKIRDDQGYWNQLEEYLRRHSEAEFSHSICKECAKKHYPDFDLSDD